MGSIDLHKKGRVAILTINRPTKLNALTADMLNMLSDYIETIEQDNALRAAVIKGAGGKAFSAGSDLAEMKKITSLELKKRVEAPQIISRLTKPIIAMLQGYVIGGGLEIALACDIRIASENVILGFPEITHGWLPAGGGGTYRLPRLIGTGKALQLILTGKQVTGRSVLEMGLVEEMYPEGELENETMKLASEISDRPLELIRFAKEAVTMSACTEDYLLFKHERALNALCLKDKGGV